MNGKPPESAYCNLYKSLLAQPFCTQKCGYCHFYVLPDKESLKDELLEGFKLNSTAFYREFQN